LSRPSVSIFINKANEVDKLAKTIGFNPIMTTDYRDYAKKLEIIAKSSIDEMQHYYALTKI